MSSRLLTARGEARDEPGAVTGPEQLYLSIVGPPSAGKASLRSALASQTNLDPKIDLTWGASAPAGSDAVVFLCDANQSAEDLSSSLNDFRDQLRQWAASASAQCGPGAFPVFLVLTKCDLLAQPGDTHSDWLERIEAVKLQVHRQVQARLPELGDPERKGFGTVALHLWAVATRRPPLKDAEPSRQDEPFGVAELYGQAVAAARDYASRRTQQRRWLQGLLFGAMAILMLMIFGAVALTLVRWTRSEKPNLAVGSKVADPVIQGEKLLGQAKSLLHFERESANEFADIPWPAWYVTAKQLSSDMERTVATLQDNHGAAALKEELREAGRRLKLLQQRVEVLGLAGSLGKHPAALAMPEFVPGSNPPSFNQWRAQWKDRVAQLGRSYSDLLTQSLPSEVPLGAVRQLQAEAQQQYQHLLDPVRAAIQAQVKELGEGKETIQAWREFARRRLGMLEKELGDWRVLANALQRLTGIEQPYDPLVQLRSFLSQERFPLPLERVDLRLPPGPAFEGSDIRELRPEGSLVIVCKPVQGQTTTLHLHRVADEDGLFRTPGAHAYLVPIQNPLVDGRLICTPGDQITAQIKLVDEQGRPWIATWTAKDSPSSIYSFSTLSGAPWLRRPDQNDPTQGRIAPGIRLQFSEPRLFELPDLFPRRPW